MSTTPKIASYFSETREYEKVLENEFAFFNGLVSAKNNIPYNPSLQKTFKDLTGFLQDRWKPLDILVEFSVVDPRSKEPHRMLLGTRLKPPEAASHAQVTHFLCLADSESFLTKVHADFDFHPTADEKKPSPHVQMGGRVFDLMRKNHWSKEPKILWDENLDKPRLPSLPICTALLWHWAFLEYQTSEQISGFLNTWHWKQLVKNAELAVLKPFFEDGVRLMNNHSNNGLLNALYVPLSK